MVSVKGKRRLSSTSMDSSYQCFDCLTDNSLIIGVESNLNSIEVTIVKDSYVKQCPTTQIHFLNHNHNDELNGSTSSNHFGPYSLVRLQSHDLTSRNRQMHHDQNLSLDPSSTEEILFGENVPELDHDTDRTESYYDNVFHTSIPNVISITKNTVLPSAPTAFDLKPPRSPVSSIPKSVKSPPKPARKVLSAYV